MSALASAEKSQAVSSPAGLSQLEQLKKFTRVVAVKLTCLTLSHWKAERPRLVTVLGCPKEGVRWESG
jgi:hypothetical protein